MPNHSGYQWAMAKEALQSQQDTPMTQAQTSPPTETILTQIEQKMAQLNVKK